MVENNPQLQDDAQILALENCCAQQVILSMFEQVADQDPQQLASRSDLNEIVRFSSALVESELIFGSPNEEVLESIQQRIFSKSQNKTNR